jgi:hypothetical protein
MFNAIAISLLLRRVNLLFSSGLRVNISVALDRKTLILLAKSNHDPPTARLSDESICLARYRRLWDVVRDAIPLFVRVSSSGESIEDGTPLSIGSRPPASTPSR